MIDKSSFKERLKRENEKLIEEVLYMKYKELTSELIDTEAKLNNIKNRIEDLFKIDESAKVMVCKNPNKDSYTIFYGSNTVEMSESLLKSKGLI